MAMTIKIIPPMQLPAAIPMMRPRLLLLSAVVVDDGMETCADRPNTVILRPCLRMAACVNISSQHVKL